MVKGNTLSRRLLLAVDAKGYGSGDDRRQRRILTELPRVLDRAADRAGLDRAGWARQPGGDGELAVLPASQSECEPVVVDDFVRELNSTLAEHNCDLSDNARLRLRLAIHHGVAAAVAEGFEGQGVVAVGRLVDSPPVRDLLTLAPAADLAVIVSDRVFLDSVAQRHTSLAPREFRKVVARLKEFVGVAYLYLPGHDVHAVQLPDYTHKPESAAAEQVPESEGGSAETGGARRPATAVTTVNAGSITMGENGVIGPVFR